MEAHDVRNLETNYCCWAEPMSSMTSLKVPCHCEFTHHFLHLFPFPLRRLSHHLNLLWKKMSTFHSCLGPKKYTTAWCTNSSPSAWCPSLPGSDRGLWMRCSPCCFFEQFQQQTGLQWHLETPGANDKEKKTHLSNWCLALTCNGTISTGYLPPCLRHFWGQSHHTLAWPMCLLCHARLWPPLYESYQGGCDCPPPGSSYPLSGGHLVLQHHWSSPKQHG